MKVLMSAYACEPGRGSEPGAGWAWACAAARDHDVWVLTHETNRAPVTTALAEDPALSARLHPVFLHNARWARPLRRKGPTRYLYYWIWQLGPCRREARRMAATIEFEVCHHLTYASDWMPAGIAAAEDVPFVWGPVGGSSTRKSPRLWLRLGLSTLCGEVARAALLDPIRAVVGRRLARRAAVVLGQNHDVAAAFAPIPVLVEPNIALEPQREMRTTRDATADDGRARVAVYAGRLLGLKGLRLAIAALTRPAATRWSLEIFGDGPMRRRLERQASRASLGDRVRFHGHRPRVEVQAALARADVLLFPSIRDAAGWSVAEATAVGCPVVALDLAGPAALVAPAEGILVDPTGDVVDALAAALDSASDVKPGLTRWGADRLPALLSSVYERAISRTTPDRQDLNALLPERHGAQ